MCQKIFVSKNFCVKNFCVKKFLCQKMCAGLSDSHQIFFNLHRWLVLSSLANSEVGITLTHPDVSIYFCSLFSCFVVYIITLTEVLRNYHQKCILPWKQLPYTSGHWTFDLSLVWRVFTPCAELAICKSWPG